jgi:hypothetical protein
VCALYALCAAKAPKRIYGDASFISSELAFSQFFSPTLSSPAASAAAASSAAARLQKQQSVHERRFVKDGFDLDLTCMCAVCCSARLVYFAAHLLSCSFSIQISHRV